MGRRSVSPADAGRKYRLYPTSAQAERLQRWGHTCRAVWNLALEQRIYAYRQRGRCLRADEQCRYLTQARRDLDWIGELPSQTPQQILRHLDRAYGNFWNVNHPARFPRFKNRSARLSIPFPGQAVRVRQANRKWAFVRIPKLGEVKFRLSRALGGEVQNATVRADASGRWYISFAVCTRNPPAPANELPPVGVDFGVKQSAYLSDESLPRLMSPSLTNGERRRLEGLERRKARQVRHARRHRGGRYGTRLRRTLREIASIKARQARRRLDFTHKLTTDLAKKHGLVAIEDLRVKSTTKSAKGVPGPPDAGSRRRRDSIAASSTTSRGSGDVSSPTSARCTGRRWSPWGPPAPRRRARSATTATRRPGTAGIPSAAPTADTWTTPTTMLPL